MLIGNRVISTIFCCALVFTANAKQQITNEKIAGEYLITFVSDTPKSEIEKALVNIQQEQGNTSAQLIKGTNIITGDIPATTLAKLHTNPYIKFIEANRNIRNQEQSQRNTNATRAYIDSWGVDRLDQADLPLNADFSPQNNGQGVNVYIIDSGIRLTHNEFQGRAHWAYTSTNITEGDDDLNGSGTMMAGTVGSRAWGVANGSTMYAVKVADQTGTATLAALVEGINFVANNHQAPAVALLGYSTTYSQTLNDAVQNAIDAGVTFVVPGGDNHRDACTRSPGSVIDAITVAASSQSDNASVPTNFGSCVDVYSPGEYIKTAWNSSDTHNNSDSHTPIAAAHVAGAAAIILGQNASCNTTEVKQQIITNTRKNKLGGVPSGTTNSLLGVPAAGELEMDCKTGTSLGSNLVVSGHIGVNTDDFSDILGMNVPIKPLIKVQPQTNEHGYIQINNPEPNYTGGIMFTKSDTMQWFMSSRNDFFNQNNAFGFFDSTSTSPTFTLFQNKTVSFGGGTIEDSNKVINHTNGAYLSAAGVWTNASSRDLKQNIKPMSADDASKALEQLNPVTYEYKANPDDPHAGFIAEDVPDMVATPDKKSLASMDIVSVLTKVVKDQQQIIKTLTQRVEALENNKQ